MPEPFLRRTVRLSLLASLLLSWTAGCQAAPEGSTAPAGDGPALNSAAVVPEPALADADDHTVSSTDDRAADDDGIAATEDCDSIAKRMSVAALDQMWGGVLEDSQNYLENCTRGSQVEKAAFYQARAQDRLRRYDQAIVSYQAFRAKYCPRGDESFLCEDASVSLFQVAADRVSKGEPGRLQILLDGLGASDFHSKVFAAIQISKLPGNEAAKAKALPVLVEANRLEDDPDLRNEICLAILRIDPTKCSGASGHGGDRPEPQMIKVRVWDCHEEKERVKVNLPFAFAEAALESLGPEIVGAIQEEGFDLENVWTSLKQLKPSERLTFSIDDDRECLNVEIWVE